MTRTAIAPPAPLAKDVRYTEKSDILRIIRKATDEANRTGLPVTIPNVIMTVEKAQDLLTLNQKNRPKSEARIADHAYKMKTGKWKNNGDSIRISAQVDELGMLLIDGQHRLNGFISAAPYIAEKNKEYVKAGKPEKQIVIMWNLVCGLAWDVVATIDTQKRRTAGDWLAFNSYKNSNNLATAIRLSILLDKGKVASKVDSDQIATEDIEEFLKDKKRDKKITELTAKAVSKYRHEAPFLKPAQWAALYYVLSGRNEKEADKFIELTVTGDGVKSTDTKTSSIYWLRRELLSMHNEEKSKRKGTPQERLFKKFYHIFKAWNYFVNGMRAGEKEIDLNKDDKDSAVLPMPSA